MSGPKHHGVQSAFPREGGHYSVGLTRRQWMAGQALAGFLAAGSAVLDEFQAQADRRKVPIERILAERSLAQADAIFEAEQREAAADAAKEIHVPKSGLCCYCGYDGHPKTPCVRGKGQTHCGHWWEGPDGGFGSKPDVCKPETNE